MFAFTKEGQKDWFKNKTVVIFYYYHGKKTIKYNVVLLAVVIPGIKLCRLWTDFKMFKIILMRKSKKNYCSEINSELFILQWSKDLNIAIWILQFSFIAHQTHHSTAPHCNLLPNRFPEKQNHLPFDDFLRPSPTPINYRRSIPDATRNGSFVLPINSTPLHKQGSPIT